MKTLTFQGREKEEECLREGEVRRRNKKPMKSKTPRE